VATKRSLLNGLRKDKRAVSPAVSTTILTSAIIVMLLVTISFANNYLNARVAESEFTAMKQFMQTIGLQVDDVAWIPGRTQTMRYTGKYGRVKLESPALNYSFYLDGSLVANFSVGIVLFNIPVSAYSIGNDYFERIFPASGNFLQNNASAPVCQVFVVEKLPMQDGSYLRVAVAPIIRQLNSIINNVTYVRLFFPILEAGPNPQKSQSVTLTGKDVLRETISNANNVTIGLDFPSGEGAGLTSDFFNFERTSETINVTSDSVVEVYRGEVIVSLGLYE
jgi:hypothetical protein